MSVACRASAAKIVAEVMAGASLNAPLAQGLAKVADVDRALLQQLCYGTLRSYHRLDAILRQLLTKNFKRKDADIHALLLVGLYQLLEMRTPDHAAISTTVEACRVLGKHWATGLVNGVLRRSSRESVQLLGKLDEAALCSHPAWLLAELKAHWPQHYEQIIAANNEHPPLCLRVNLQKISRSDYLQRLQEDGVAAANCTYSNAGIRLQAAVDVTRLPGFAEGLVSVQDEAAQLATQLLQPLAGERILDACAAPGGKACHLLEFAPALAELVAMDADASRLTRVEENLQRLNLSATLLVADASEPPAALVAASFDRILVDAPCSGSGVIRRHPDIKLLRRADDIARLAQTQLAILEGLWPLLRSGGRLLYVSCSILPLENQAVIASFLEQQPAARLQPLDVDWGIDCAGARQLLPQENGPDGMYFALLEKL